MKDQSQEAPKGAKIEFYRYVAEQREIFRRGEEWLDAAPAEEWFHEWSKDFEGYCDDIEHHSDLEEAWTVYVRLCQWIAERVHRAEAVHETVQDLLEEIDTGDLGYFFGDQMPGEFAELLRLRHPDPDSPEAYHAARTFAASDLVAGSVCYLYTDFVLQSVEPVLKVARDSGLSESGHVR